MSEQVVVRLTGSGWSDYGRENCLGREVIASGGSNGWFSGSLVGGRSPDLAIGRIMADSMSIWAGELVADHVRAPDSVNHPSHYTDGPKCECGRVIECITITRRMMFSVGNAMKYLWRAGKKGDASLSDLEKEREDVAKAEWYCRDRKEELDRLIASKKPDES